MSDRGVFLTDFGLAKNIATGSKYTRTGETLGTPAYMSPEQARGELAELTPASDVWALGCVLYEMLSGGRKAFEGATPAAAIGLVLTATPRRLEGVPRRIVDLIDVALQREPAGRPQTAGAWLPDLALVLAGGRPRRRAPWSR